MAIGDNVDAGFEKNLWSAACVLWGHIPAADYRKVIVGLIFLRYISYAFEKRFNELVAEGDGFENDPDAYAEENVFFVPENARWKKIAVAAHTPEIGTVIDNAMREIEVNNKKLKNVLPKNYSNPDLDKRVLGEVVDMFTNIKMSDSDSSKDLLGRTYEYCIAQFAAYEGVKGGEFCTRTRLFLLTLVKWALWSTGSTAIFPKTTQKKLPTLLLNFKPALWRASKVFVRLLTLKRLKSRIIF